MSAAADRLEDIRARSEQRKTVLQMGVTVGAGDAADVEFLLALVREQAAKLEAVRSELAHAEMNGHFLSGDCQGVGPGEKIPAVRASFIRAALEVSP